MKQSEIKPADEEISKKHNYDVAMKSEDIEQYVSIEN